MSIYKKDGKYIVKVSIQGKQVLRRKYLGLTMTTKEQALSCEKDLFLCYGSSFDSYHINDLFNLYYEYLYHKYKETSAKRYIFTFNSRIKKYFLDKDVKDLNRTYLEFVNDSLNNQVYKDKQYLISLTKQFLIFLTNYGFNGNTNLFYAYRINKVRVTDYDFYSYEEFKLLYSVIDDDTYRLLFTLLFYYGLRIGELRGLKVCDFKKDRVSINKEFTNKARFGNKVLDPKNTSSIRSYPYVVNIRSLFDIVVSKNKLKSNNFVFASPTSSVLGETTIRRKLKYYCGLCNLRTIKIHEFRHSCATFLINKNVDIKAISVWLGHSSVQTTLKVYAHILPLKKEEVKQCFDTTDTVFSSVKNKKTSI